VLSKESETTISAAGAEEQRRVPRVACVDCFGFVWFGHRCCHGVGLRGCTNVSLIGRDGLEVEIPQDFADNRPRNRFGLRGKGLAPAMRSRPAMYAAVSAVVSVDSSHRNPTRCLSCRSLGSLRRSASSG
jgi:hypothetical protein